MHSGVSDGSVDKRSGLRTRSARRPAGGENEFLFYAGVRDPPTVIVLRLVSFR